MFSWTMSSFGQPTFGEPKQTVSATRAKPFLDLPTEIRLAIYKRLFAGAHLNIEIKVENQKLTIWRVKYSYRPSKVHAALLETCSKVHTKAVPIMAGAINLIICFDDVVRISIGAPGSFIAAILSRCRDLDLGKLAGLTYAPTFLSKIMPSIRMITYSNKNQMGLCFNMAAFPELEILTVRDTPDYDESEMLPHIDALGLCNSSSLDARLTERIREQLMSGKRWAELKDVLETQDCKFRVLCRTTLSFQDHRRRCDARPGSCICQRGGVWPPESTLPTFVCSVHQGCR
jgi:hypothetical protein